MVRKEDKAQANDNSEVNQGLRLWQAATRKYLRSDTDKCHDPRQWS